MNKDTNSPSELESLLLNGIDSQIRYGQVQVLADHHFSHSDIISCEGDYYNFSYLIRTDSFTLKNVLVEKQESVKQRLEEALLYFRDKFSKIRPWDCKVEHCDILSISQKVPNQP